MFMPSLTHGVTCFVKKCWMEMTHF